MSDSPESPKTEAIEWPFDATLYSRTDKRGVISYANDVMCQTSGYDPSELIGSPHKIVRHPDMPKGAFWLYWEMIKRGEIACLYVKNRAKNGRYYWAFATAVPIEEGYISVRVRPQSEMHRKVMPVYAECLKLEAEKSLSAEQSAKLLLEKIEALGYASYHEFMAAAISDELHLRREKLALPDFVYGKTIVELRNGIDQVKTITDTLSRGFRNIRGEPINMRILASRIEGSGAAVSSISQNYEVMSGEMWEELSKVGKSDKGGQKELHQMFRLGHFDLMLTELLSEMADRFRSSIAEEGDAESGKLEMQLLERVAADVRAEALVKIHAVVDGCQNLPDTCRRLRRRVNGLDVVKLFCRVESGRISGVDSGLEGIIERLNRFHSDVDRHLSDLSLCARQIGHSGRQLVEQTEMQRAVIN